MVLGSGYDIEFGFLFRTPTECVWINRARLDSCAECHPGSPERW